MDVIISKTVAGTEATVLPLFKGEKPVAAAKQKLKLELSNLIEVDFKAEAGSTQVLYTPQGRLILLGLGDKKQFQPETWRVTVHSAVTALQKLGVASASLILPAVSVTQISSYLELTGFALCFSQYQFNWYQKEKNPLKLTKVEVVAPQNKSNRDALEKGFAIGVAANTARDLANHPANIATPTHLAKHAVEIAKKYKFSSKVLGPKEIEAEGLGLIMGVSKGSEEPPQFIVLDYGDKKKQPVVLIGKGLTFDSGGISIKPAERMEEMKFDMCGGATVLGIFEAVAKLNLPIRLVGIIPSSENLLSGKATKPGDILIAHDKTSVEIINTDAEGRLVLADAISYAQKYYKPRLMIDYATLTGAVLIALGDQYSGYFANTKAYDQKLSQAGDKVAEKFWSLPLAPEYNEQLKSLVADIKNIGDRGSAGATTAALFLQHFVKDTPWIHFDIAGTAWTMRPRPYASPGATAWGVYLTVEFLRNIK